MHVYLVRRLLLVIPTLLGVSIIVFMLVRLLPGDAVTMLLQDYAYAARCRRDASHSSGSIGPSTCSTSSGSAGSCAATSAPRCAARPPSPTSSCNRMPVTLELGRAGDGVRADHRHPDRRASRPCARTPGPTTSARSAAIGLLAIPSFWLGTLVVTLPSVWWGWTPPLRYTRLLDDPVKNLAQVIIPAIILGLASPAR